MFISKIASIIAVIILSASLLAIPPVRQKAMDVVFDWVTYQLDKEEAERKAKVERHEAIYGKDTAFIWNKHYDIHSQSGEKRFAITIEDADASIMGKVSLIDVYKDQFYVVSEEGYAVVDKENKCRVFLLTDRKRIESKYIEYLTSYEQYSQSEIEHFKKMIDKNKRKV